MTLEQKVAQMIQGEIRDVTPQDVIEYGLGSVLNGGGAFPQENKYASVQDWVELADAYYLASVDTSGGGSGIPIIWGTDAVHGHNNVMGATLFPHNIGLGATRDPQLVSQIIGATAREVKATGIDWIFAPTVAVAKDTRWGRTYESFSSDPCDCGVVRVSQLSPRCRPRGLHQRQSILLATAEHCEGMIAATRVCPWTSWWRFMGRDTLKR
jgi:beta-glucosidase